MGSDSLGFVPSVLTVWRHEWKVLRGQSLWMIPSGALLAVLYQASMGVGLSKSVTTSGPGWSGASYFSYLAPGLLVLTLFNGAFTDSIDGIYKRAVLTRFYVDLLRRPVTSLEVACGAIMACATRSFLYALGYLACSVAMGLNVSLIGSLCFAAFAALVFASMSLALGLRADSKMQLDTLRFLTLPLTLFSGLFFPIDGYWTPCRWLVAALPLWQARRAGEGFLTGEYISVMGSVAYLAACLPVFIGFARDRLAKLQS